jgi:hypothetical protein
MASTIARFQCSGFLPVVTPKPLVQLLLTKKDALQHSIVDVCQTIRNNPGFFEWMQLSMMRRFETCIESHGGHSEHLL